MSFSLSCRYFFMNVIICNRCKVTQSSLVRLFHALFSMMALLFSFICFVRLSSCLVVFSAISAISSNCLATASLGSLAIDTRTDCIWALRASFPCISVGFVTQSCFPFSLTCGLPQTVLNSVAFSTLDTFAMAVCCWMTGVGPVFERLGCNQDSVALTRPLPSSEIVMLLYVGHITYVLDWCAWHMGSTNTVCVPI